MNELSFVERINIQCDVEAKALIREKMSSSGSPTLPFRFNPPVIRDKSNNCLTSTDMTSVKMCGQIAAPYIEKKLNVASTSEIDWCFRKSVVQNLPDMMLTWLSKSFINFTGIAHQLHRQNIVSSLACRMCHVAI